MVVNVSEAKTKLSKLIEMVQHGERVVIVENDLPIADLVMHEPARKRRLGILNNEVKIPDDFLAEDEEINEMFYGKDK